MFIGTLEERARDALERKGRKLTNKNIFYQMCSPGELVIVQMDDEFYQPWDSVEDDLKRVIYNLRGVCASDGPVSVKEMAEKGWEMGYPRRQVLVALREAWKAGEVTRFIEGLFAAGIREEHLELYRQFFSTDELYEYVARKARNKRKGRGSGVFGVQYILRGQDAT